MLDSIFRYIWDVTHAIMRESRWGNVDNLTLYVSYECYDAIRADKRVLEVVKFNNHHEMCSIFDHRLAIDPNLKGKDFVLK